MECAGANGNSRELWGCPRCLLCISWALKGSFFSFEWQIKITNYYKRLQNNWGLLLKNNYFWKSVRERAWNGRLIEKGGLGNCAKNSMRWLCIVLQRVDASIWAWRSSVNYWKAVRASVAHQENAADHFLGIFYFWGSFERNNPAVEVKVEAASQRFLAFLNCSATENQGLQQRLSTGRNPSACAQFVLW